MRNFIYTTVAIAAIATLQGCAAPAAIDQMTLRTGDFSETTNQQLEASVKVDEVAGGKTTNPLWTSQVSTEDYRSALENSLKLTGYLSNGDTSEKYLLSASLLELKQPVLGINLKVICKTQYRLIDKQTGQEIYNKIVETPYTATFSDSALAVTRLKIANEGAVRENIKTLVAELDTLKVPLAAVTIGH